MHQVLIQKQFLICSSSLHTLARAVKTVSNGLNVSLKANILATPPYKKKTLAVPMAPVPLCQSQIPRGLS
jgi:hypothetical protein